MTLLSFAFGAAAAASLAGLASSQDPGKLVSDDPRAARLSAWLQRAEPCGLTGAALVARGGKVLVACGIGSEDPKGERPCTARTRFEIASASKQFTGSSILALAQEGKLSLTDPIGKLLPDVPEACGAITVRMLLDHTSGIPGTNSSGGGDDLARVVPLFLKGGPKHPPGTHWEYWNQGYALLAGIVERASGKGYTEYLRERLFAPAGLVATGFTGDRAGDGETIATGTSQRGPRTALEHPYGSYGYQYRGMGGVVTNVWDLWRWDRALRGDEILDAERKKEMFRPTLNDYACGWFVRKNAKGRVVQSHGGAVRGFVCEVRRYPDDDGFLAVLCNRDDLPVRAMADALEDLAFDAAAKRPLPPKPLAKPEGEPLVGSYAHGVSGATLEVVAAEGRFVATVRWPSWQGRSGVVTTGSIGRDDAGRMVVCAWTSVPVLKPAKGGGSEVVAIEVDGTSFARVAK